MYEEVYEKLCAATAAPTATPANNQAPERNTPAPPPSGTNTEMHTPNANTVWLLGDALPVTTKAAHEEEREGAEEVQQAKRAGNANKRQRPL